MTFGPLSTTTYAVNGVSFDMVRLPPGRLMDGEGSARRELLVSRPFELGLTQVTQALWRAVTGSSPSKFKGEDRPVEQVSHDDVQDFLALLPALGLTGFRLPTEAEWAWAARCGASTRWAGADRANPVAFTGTMRTEQPDPIAGRKVDPAGLFDLSGNVWEWSSDGRDHPTEGRAGGVDPVSLAGVSRIRMSRGGSWGAAPRSSRVALRTGMAASSQDSHFGFRLLRTQSSQDQK